VTANNSSPLRVMTPGLPRGLPVKQPGSLFT
jgi:hypothetical protein